ncbi:hypothetical protein QTO30_08640 [Yoonia sp. GPGPB17]|uniref:hypothetical protein n=1 Tax=Yoonia sp. GPGPB17 TaxID=3026147 RepID=UPI0030C26BD7
MSDTQNDITQKQLGLARSLRQTGRCVTRMGHAVLDLEHQLLDGATSKPQTNEAMESLQAMDLLKQMADDLSSLLDRLADALPESMTVDQDGILGPMKLQELRDMICGVGDTDSAYQHRVSDKEIELF